MANEPSAFGLIVLTGMTIAAVVGLYAYDVIPRRDGLMPSTDIAWPRWQSNDQARWQSNAPPSEPAQSYSQPNDQQQQSNQPPDQGYGPPNQPSQYPQQEPRGQDLPDDQQSGQSGVGQPAPPDEGQRR
jgi:hypothetical protein